MTDKPLAQKTIAILAANGFEETEMTEPQRALLAAGAVVRLVSPEQALVNGWHGGAWGHYFPVEVPLSSALAADFDGLIVPGGERSVQKLLGAPHMQRFVNGFMDAEKPVAVIGGATNLLAAADRAKGRKVAADETTAEALGNAGAETLDQPLVTDGALISARDDVSPSALRDEILRLFCERLGDMAEAA